MYCQIISEVLKKYGDLTETSSLLLHHSGYEKYNQMRQDPGLCFLHRCGPPDGSALLAEEIDNEDDMKYVVSLVFVGSYIHINSLLTDQKCLL